MPRKPRFSLLAVLSLIPVYLVAGVVVQEFSNSLQPADAETEAPAAEAATAAAEEKPAEALQRILDQRLVINTHEHIQDLRQGPALIKAMDAFGMHKTILVGSSWFTITLIEGVGFTRYDENNEELLKFVKEYPDRFEAYPTLDPQDPQKLEKLKSLVERGATGVKLYLGHGYTRRDNGQYMFHTMAMDDPRMFPVYEYCEKNFVPLCFHMQPFKPGFAQEFIAVLTAFPDLKVVCPHFILSSSRLGRLREFLLTFPNLHSDISFGHDDFLREGLLRISKDPAGFRQLFEEFPERFMFGTDLVMTDRPAKTVPWFSERAQTYYDMLTKAEYSTPLLPGQVLRGLELTSPVLDNILYKNYERFEALQPQGTKITREFIWDVGVMGVQKMERQPGQTFSAPPVRRRR